MALAAGRPFKQTSGGPLRLESMILGTGLQLVIAFSWKVFDANHDQEIQELTQRQKAAAKEQSHATAYVS